MTYLTEKKGLRGNSFRYNTIHFRISENLGAKEGVGREARLSFFYSAHWQVSCCVLRMQGRLEIKYQQRILGSNANSSLNNFITLKQAKHTPVSNDQGILKKQLNYLYAL